MSMYVVKHIFGFVVMVIMIIALTFIFSNVLGYIYMQATYAYTATSNALGYGADSTAYSLFSTYGSFWSWTIDALLVGLVLAFIIGAAKRRHT